MLRRFAGALLAILMSFAPLWSAADTAGTTTIRLNVNPEVLTTLPLLIAIEKGLFTEEHLDVKVVLSTGTSATLVPSLARGDLDISNLTASPSFFNQVAQGFDAKIFAAWTQDDFDYQGEFYHLKGVREKPKPYGATLPIKMNAGISGDGRAFALRNCEA